MPELKTKAGRVTAYGFACGYIEHNGGRDGWTATVRLEKDPHVTAYRVRWDRGQREAVFHTLGEARKAYAAKCKELKT